jgi:FMN reductase
MASVVTIGGSPSASSKTAALLTLIRSRLEPLGILSAALNVRDLPAEDLIDARSSTAALQNALRLVQEADGVVIATPIYKAAYSGILKVFLDLLPQDALAGKIILPIATGSTLAHALVIDYALRPVLAALGAFHVLNGIYLVDNQFVSTSGAAQLETSADERLTSAVMHLARLLNPAQPQPPVQIGQIGEG